MSVNLKKFLFILFSALVILLFCSEVGWAKPKRRDKPRPPSYENHYHQHYYHPYPHRYRHDGHHRNYPRYHDNYYPYYRPTPIDRWYDDYYRIRRFRLDFGNGYIEFGD